MSCSHGCLLNLCFFFFFRLLAPRLAVGMFQFCVGLALHLDNCCVSCSSHQSKVVLVLSCMVTLVKSTSNTHVNNDERFRTNVDAEGGWGLDGNTALMPELVGIVICLLQIGTIPRLASRSHTSTSRDSGRKKLPSSKNQDYIVFLVLVFF